MKKLITVIMVAAMLLSLLVGCAPSKESNGSKPGDNGSIGDSVLKQQSRQKFYDYLLQVEIPEKGLADLSVLSWIHCDNKTGVASNVEHLLDQGRGGLLSAVVRDFDLDGDEDMVTFYMTAMPHNETWPAIYGSSHITRDDYVISMSYFTLEKGEVVCKDSYPCAILLDGASWGYIGIYMEQLEDGIYIYSYSNATDYTTYGASPITVFHVANDSFVFDYISGIGYGQGSLSQNPNILMGTTNINPQDYTFGKDLVRASEVDPMGDDRENRWVYWGEFKSPDHDGVMSYTGTDYTGLRTILEKGLDAFPHLPLPQGGLKPPSPTKATAEALAQKIADYISAETGIPFTGCKTYYFESSDTATIRYETAEYTIFSIEYDGTAQRITGFTVATNDYPVPQEWQDIKDAALLYPEFGLIKEELSPFLGTLRRFSYMDGYPVTGATIQTLQISDTEINVTFE